MQVIYLSQNKIRSASRLKPCVVLPSTCNKILGWNIILIVVFFYLVFIFILWSDYKTYEAGGFVKQTNKGQVQEMRNSYVFKKDTCASLNKTLCSVVGHL
jgi:hypothetical protein